MAQLQPQHVISWCSHLDGCSHGEINPHAFTTQLYRTRDKCRKLRGEQRQDLLEETFRIPVQTITSLMRLGEEPAQPVEEILSGRMEDVVKLQKKLQSKTNEVSHLRLKKNALVEAKKGILRKYERLKLKRK